ncbi:MAG TPA: hypothetical protein VGW40_08040 [Allosphingosinicella sp.]|nr:hypothetical protein [Allosphingosinicella sp.]
MDKEYRSGIPPFMLPRKGPATQGERALLHLPTRSPPPPRATPGEPERDGR